MRFTTKVSDDIQCFCFSTASFSRALGFQNMAVREGLGAEDKGCRTEGSECRV
jgi:hypothetical protein